MYAYCSNIDLNFVLAIAMQTDSSQAKPQKSARLGIRATPEQEILLKRAAEIRHKSLTDFILDSACTEAEHTLLDQRLITVSGRRYRSLLELLDQPPQDNPGLLRLFAKKAPWERG